MIAIFKTLGLAAAILLIALAGRAAGIDTWPLVMLMSGAVALGIFQSGHCGGLA